MTTRRLAIVLALAALSLVPAAEAKFRISLALAPAKPLVGQPVRVVLRTDTTLPDDHGLRLLAVAPGIDKYTAIRSLEGSAPSRRHGFIVALVRTGTAEWTASVRFTRAGRWTLVVPNWGAPGYAIPPPVVRPVVVRPRVR